MTPPVPAEGRTGEEAATLSRCASDLEAVADQWGVDDFVVAEEVRDLIKRWRTKESS